MYVDVGYSEGVKRRRSTNDRVDRIMGGMSTKAELSWATKLPYRTSGC